MIFADTEVGMAHVALFGRLGKRQSEPAKIIGGHGQRPQSRARVVRPMALSHSAGFISSTVWAKVQMWPSGSRAR